MQRKPLWKTLSFFAAASKVFLISIPAIYNQEKFCLRVSVNLFFNNTERMKVENYITTEQVL